MTIPAQGSAARTGDAGDLEFQAHIFDGGRCIFCNVNRLDDEIHGPFDCIKRGQYVYSTETPAADDAPDQALPVLLAAPTSVVEVAERLLDLGGEMPVSKLQSLVYLSQGHHLAATGQPLFEETIEAWAEGPVVPELHALCDGATVVGPGFFHAKLKVDDHPSTERK